MGCPANPKKFLGLISYEGRHQWWQVSIRYFSWWSVVYECEFCHTTNEQWPVSEQNLYRMGFDVEKLREKIRNGVMGIHGEDIQEYLR